MKRDICDGDFFGRLEALSLNYKTVMSGGFGGGHKSTRYGSSVEFADFREYTPGDDIRRIDWNIYGRFERYFIKLYVDERQLSTHIYIDCSSSMEWGEPEKAAAALRFAAAAGFMSVQEMDKVVFRAIEGGQCRDITGTIVGREAFYDAAHILGELAFEGESDIGAAVQSALNPGYDNGLSIIISDFLTENDWKSAVDFLCYRHREVLLVQILSPDELDPTLSGRVFLRDLESASDDDGRNMKYDINNAALKAYSEAVEFYTGELRSFAASRGAGYMLVNAATPIERVIFKDSYEAGLVK